MALPGDRVVLEGCDSCRQGQAVRAVPSAAGASPVPGSQPGAPGDGSRQKAGGHV